MKVCTRCNVEKPKESFKKHSRYKGGLDYTCKQRVKEVDLIRVNDHKNFLAEKKCTKCGNVKSRENFHINTSARGGLSSQCKSCAKIYHAKRYLDNTDKIYEWVYAYRGNPGVKDHLAAAGKVWRSCNVDRVNARRRLNHKVNPEKENSRGREWRRANPDSLTLWRKSNPGKVLATKAKRRALKLQADVSWRSTTAIRSIYTESNRLTLETGIPYEVDHIVPLVSDLVCGLHWEGNLQIITREQNRKKSNIYWPGHPDENYDKLVP